MQEADKILKLLEDGKELELLSQENKTQILNELQQYDLVEVVEGRFRLTEKGKEATKVGACKFITQEKDEKKATEFIIKKQVKRGDNLVFGLLLLVLVIILFYLFNLDTFFTRV